MSATLAASAAAPIATRVLLRAHGCMAYSAATAMSSTTPSSVSCVKSRLVDILVKGSLSSSPAATIRRYVGDEVAVPIIRHRQAAVGEEGIVVEVMDSTADTKNSNSNNSVDNSNTHELLRYSVVEMNPRDGMVIDAEETTIVLLESFGEGEEDMAGVVVAATTQPPQRVGVDNSPVVGDGGDEGSYLTFRLELVCGVGRSMGGDGDDEESCIGVSQSPHLPILMVPHIVYKDVIRQRQQNRQQRCQRTPSSAQTQDEEGSPFFGEDDDDGRLFAFLCGVPARVISLPSHPISSTNINNVGSGTFTLQTSSSLLFSQVAHAARRDYNCNPNGMDVVHFVESGGGNADDGGQRVSYVECRVVVADQITTSPFSSSLSGFITALEVPTTMSSSPGKGTLATEMVVLGGVKLAPLLPAPLRNQACSEAALWSSLSSFLKKCDNTAPLFMKSGDILQIHTVSPPSSNTGGSHQSSSSSHPSPNMIEDELLGDAAGVIKNLVGKRKGQPTNPPAPANSSHKSSTGRAADTNNNDGGEDAEWRPSVSIEGLGGGGGGGSPMTYIQVVAANNGSSISYDDGGWYIHGVTKVSIEDCSPLPGPVALPRPPSDPSSLSIANSISDILSGATFTVSLARCIQRDFLMPCIQHMDDSSAAAGAIDDDSRNHHQNQQQLRLPHVSVGVVECGAASNLPFEHCLAATTGNMLMLPTVVHDCRNPSGGYTSKSGETTTISADEARKYGLGSGGDSTVNNNTNSGLGIVPCLGHITVQSCDVSCSSPSPSSTAVTSPPTSSYYAATRPTVLIVNHCELLDEDPVQLNAVRMALDTSRGYVLLLLVFTDEGGSKGSSSSSSSALSLFKNMAAFELKLESATKETDRELIISRLFLRMQSPSAGGSSSDNINEKHHPPHTKEYGQMVSSSSFHLKQSHTLTASLVASWTTGFTTGDLLAFIGSVAHECVAKNIRSHTTTMSLGDDILPREDDETPTSSSSLSKISPAKQRPNISIFLTDEFVADRLGAYQRTHGFVVSSTKLQPVKWSDVGGLEDVKKEILETIRLPTKYPHLFKKSGGLKRKMGILLFGPPGCGKTLLAKAVATEMAMNFLSVKGPELINQYVGESERNVRDVFQRARDNSPCVLFFDELDALAPARGAKGDAGGAMDRIVSQLLVEMDGAAGGGGEVFLVAATNRPDMLDAALLRPGRLDQRCYLGPPETKVDILLALKALTRKFDLDDDVDLDGLAGTIYESGVVYTGADMFALCSDAMILGVEGYIAAQLELEKKTVDCESTLSSVAELEAEQQPKPENDGEPATVSITANTNAKKATTVAISMQHFNTALAKLSPSVTPAEFKQYKELRESINGR